MSYRTRDRAQAFLSRTMLIRPSLADGLKKVSKENKKGSGQTNSPHARCRIKEPEEKESKNKTEERADDKNPHVIHLIYPYGFGPFTGIAEGDCRGLSVQHCVSYRIAS